MIVQITGANSKVLEMWAKYENRSAKEIVNKLLADAGSYFLAGMSAALQEAQKELREGE